ncbi:MAG: hypothetical protein WAL64_01450 [Candidatus Dormiibacterota bacterium]
MEQTVLELRFEPGEASARQIQEALAAVLSEIQSSADEHEQEADEGADAASLSRVQGTVTEAGRGFAGADIVIQIAGPVVADVLTKLWDEVIWPRLRKRIGVKGVGTRKNPS